MEDVKRISFNFSEPHKIRTHLELDIQKINNEMAIRSRWVDVMPFVEFSYYKNYERPLVISVKVPEMIKEELYSSYGVGYYNSMSKVSVPAFVEKAVELALFEYIFKIKHDEIIEELRDSAIKELEEAKKTILALCSD